MAADTSTMQQLTDSIQNEIVAGADFHLQTRRFLIPMPMLRTAVFCIFESWTMHTAMLTATQFEAVSGPVKTLRPANSHVQDCCAECIFESDSDILSLLSE